MSWHVAADNDYFNFWIAPEHRTDLNYAHGADLTILGLPLPELPGSRSMRTLAGGPHARSVVGLRQEVYLPSNVRDGMPGDRPCAGWLEVNVGFQTETATHMQRASLHLGSTGSPSLGEKTLRWFHHAFGFESRQWKRQIPSEPGIALDVRGAARALSSGEAEPLRLVVAPEWRARLGTHVIDGTAGVRAAFGYHPPPAWRGSGLPAAAPASFYGIAGARADVVARSVYFDGAWLRDSPGADKRIVVPEVEYGVGLRAWGVRAEWRVTRRGKDFDAQVTPHTYSTLAVSWVPRAARP